MKFDWGLSYAEKFELKKVWHDFFTLIPRRVAHRDCRWLEVIERRGTYSPWTGWVWEYRVKGRIDK